MSKMVIKAIIGVANWHWGPCQFLFKAKQHILVKNLGEGDKALM
jgi:hypothetical protein